jgi:hypothetical protein
MRNRPGARWVVLAVLVAVAVVLATRPGVGAESRKAQSVQLAGKDLSTWQKPTGDWVIAGGAKTDPANPKRLVTTPGTGVLVNGPAGNTGNIHSKFQHGDVEAHVEFMVSQGSNSGVYFQGRYEIQVFDSWKVEHPKYSDCGGIYERWGEKGGYEGQAPKVNASREPGQWQTFDVIFRAPRFDANGKKTANAKFLKVVHNGKLIHENVEVTGPTRAATYENDEKPLGPLMLQGDHGPVAYRNVRLRPLKAEK